MLARFALALVVPALAASPAREDVRLGLGFKAGDELRYRIVQETEQVVTVPAPQRSSSSIAQVLRQKVKSVSPDGVATLECSWEAFQLRLESQTTGLVEFDSTRGEAREKVPETLAGLAEAVGLAFEIVIGPNGAIADVRGIADARKKVLAASGPTSNPMRPTLEQMFDAEELKRALEVAVLPGQPLATGASWARDVEVPMGPLGKFRVHGTYALGGIEDHRGTRCARIDVIRETSVAGSGPDFSSLPFADKLDVSLAIDEQGGAGTLHYSLEPGRLVRAELANHVTATLKMKRKPGVTEGIRPMETTVAMDNAVRILLLGKDEPAFEPPAKVQAQEPKK